MKATSNGPQASVSAIRHHSLMVEENSVTHSAGMVGGDASRPWQTLSSGFEQARAREDSLDRLVEWPAERALLGDVTGLAVLDAGCGNGAKVTQLADDGAARSVGVDISGNFIVPPPGVELVEGDLSDLAAVPGLAGRRFDRILFLQSFGYAADGVKALQIARDMCRCHRTRAVTTSSSPSAFRKRRSSSVERKSSKSSGEPVDRSYHAATSGTGAPEPSIRKTCAPSSGNTA